MVNAAAYTAVDAAETDAAAAARANHEGPAALAALCAAAGVPLIHVSTDYVFDGRKAAPYTEADPTAPQGVYGATKLAGEQAVLAAGARAIVMRTSWVYSATGKNFVRTMLNAAQRMQAQGDGVARLRVVADQQGCPTSADDLAAAILNIAGAILSDGWREAYGGVVHAAGSGATTWHGLAVATFEAAFRHGKADAVGRRHRHRRLADPGAAPGGFAAGLRPVAARVRPKTAALAGQPGPRRGHAARSRRAALNGHQPALMLTHRK